MSAPDCRLRWRSPIYDRAGLASLSGIHSGDDLATLPDRLRHVRFIGGGSGSGKSTIAHRLAQEYALRLHQTEVAQRHERVAALLDGTLDQAAQMVSVAVQVAEDEQNGSLEPSLPR